MAGSRTVIEFENETVIGGWFWGHGLIGKDYCIRGEQNKMSPWLKPIRWKPQPPLGEENNG